MQTLDGRGIQYLYPVRGNCEASFVPGPAFIKKHKHHHNTDQTAEDKYISKSNLNFDRFSHMIKRLAHSSRQSDNLDLPYVMDG